MPSAIFLAYIVLAIYPDVRVITVGKQTTCTGSIFAQKGDKWAGSHFACTRKPVDDKTPGVAVRNLRCGAKVRVCRVRKTATGDTLCTDTKVIDRGPYGALLPKGSKCPKQAKRCYQRPNGQLWYVKKRKSWPGTWTGCVDLTPPTARAIQHNGWERVTIQRLDKTRRPTEVAVLCGVSR